MSIRWQDEGYLISKKNYSENSIIIEVFTKKYGKRKGIVYGGSSRKIKNYLQIGNKILIIWHSKSEDKIGYFSTEIIKPVSPLYFDDKKKTVCIQSACSILRILLPENQENKKIYNFFENFLLKLNNQQWIIFYILWEYILVKELGFDVEIYKTRSLNSNLKNGKIDIMIGDNLIKVPKFIFEKQFENLSADETKEALAFNRNLILYNFISPYKLKLPISRTILEKYFE